MPRDCARELTLTHAWHGKNRANQKKEHTHTIDTVAQNSTLLLGDNIRLCAVIATQYACIDAKVARAYRIKSGRALE